MRPSVRRPLAILFGSLFMVMLGFGIIIPILPFYVKQFGGAPSTYGYLLATYSVLQLLLAPSWGRLSDRIGRRPVLLLGLSGYGFTHLLNALATDLWMLFAARILAGLLSSATLPTAMAYVADITTPEERAKGMGIVGAAMGLGMIFGPALGGLLSHYGLGAPFFFSALLGFLLLPLAWKWLPESLPSPQPARPSVPRFSRALLRHPLFPFFLMGFGLSGSMAMFESTFALFSNDRLGLSLQDMGLMFASLGLVGVFIQVKLLAPLIQKLGDLKVLLGGALLTAAGLLLTLGAWDRTSMWAACAVFAVGSTLLRPSVSTLVTKLTDEGQGSTAGMLQSFDSLGRAVGPVIGGWAYEHSTSLPNLVGASVLLGLLLATFPAMQARLLARAPHP